ncbi:TRMT2A [Cordylochernes scorpioides]|uniref:tRNA (uracil(54)-C(5))-methyltransferase n=1 Tax=Cordylochernes scorpioides TaxID=51811 RepID=A0ABY6LA66_9ARAC|nr:TRMT2A [Cordylochernes scorpioides]
MIEVTTEVCGCREEGNKLCCTLESIQPSPVTEDYRNKCEFSVGLHRDSLLPTVGFRLSSYRQGSMSVAEPVDCWIVPPAMTKLAATFQEYIRQNSQLEVFNPETYQGYWRGLTARTSRGGDLLVIVVMHPQSLSEEDIDAEKKKLKEYFECGSGKKCGVTSLWLHLFDKRRAEGEQEHSLFHLSGNKGLTEELLGLKFHVAPEAFFQVNTAGAEVLYNQVGKLLEVGPSTVVLDICCGTGTIGLSLAKQHVQRVIGIELCSQAVQNAKLNAQVNGHDNHEVTNAQFVCGRAEDSIYNVLQAVPASSEAVAILDPPRAGLNNKVVKALRGCTQLNKLVYIACNPAGALNNMVDLCRATSKSYRGEPFYPVKAVPVDLFPHTQHCELAVLFQRRSPQ